MRRQPNAIRYIEPKAVVQDHSGGGGGGSREVTVFIVQEQATNSAHDERETCARTCTTLLPSQRSCPLRPSRPRHLACPLRNPRQLCASSVRSSVRRCACQLRTGEFSLARSRVRTSSSTSSLSARMSTVSGPIRLPRAARGMLDRSWYLGDSWCASRRVGDKVLSPMTVAGRAIQLMRAKRRACTPRW